MVKTPFKCSVCQKVGAKLYRRYGSILEHGDIYCKAHKPDKWAVPLVDDGHGNVWGLSSVPQKDYALWEALPDS